ncbi:glycosyltransferase family 2 protein [Amphritea sp. 1_MG-2023]|uniref:glycosyltransferase family 2 protein n=1 Tax=Amphritea sp. 1_MG-2023 TaxID=3062670 RepID=UPI0026E19ACC|nr:glycosyltransferase family 2 protein [Amphritea sp. 1_MG-2023]MDO6564789.1 glycosyltransferase family 2 protein [Amphritea sp. 1_MG-2023]
MTILVKNEADIIEDNIRYHAAQGVQCFAVMDNASDDGTREILEVLKSEFDLHVIDQPDQNYQQARWMTELAEYCRTELKADLVISNDADEFWQAEEAESLQDYLHYTDSVVTVRRYNMALDYSVLSKGYHYSHASLRVKNPILYDSSAQINETAVAMLLVKISPKTIVNPYGLIRLKGGNHRAKHVWKLMNARNEPGISVHHYPIRNYAQFERNIQNRKRLLETTNAKMGDHYRRWVRMLNEGTLEDEFKRFILNQQEIDTLLKLGVLEHKKLSITNS